MAEQAQAAGGASTTTTEFDASKWLEDATTKMKVNEDPASRKRGLDAINQFIQNAMQPGQVLQKDVETTLRELIESLKRLWRIVRCETIDG